MENISVSEEAFKNLLVSTNYNRSLVGSKVEALAPRPIPNEARTWLKKAAEIGGLKPGDTFAYATPLGENTAKVVSLYDIPEEMVNPFLVCLPGSRATPIFCMEALRFYAKKTGKLLPFLALAREQWVMELMSPADYVRKYQLDTEKLGVKELHHFAKQQHLKEVTCCLISGATWEEKLTLAKAMLELCSIEDIKINIVLIHCPLRLNGYLPETSVSEASLRSAASAIGSLMHDTITFDGTVASSATPDKYLMPGIVDADWADVKDLIANYADMPYAIKLYGTNHQKAMTHVILADIFGKYRDNSAAWLEKRACIDMVLDKYLKRFIGDMPNAAENAEELLEWFKNNKEPKLF